MLVCHIHGEKVSPWELRRLIIALKEAGVQIIETRVVFLPEECQDNYNFIQGKL